MDKVYSMLGMAQKAGKIISGGQSVKNSINKSKLVVLSKDCSANTKKRFESLCRSRQIDIAEYGNQDTLGRCIGRAHKCVLSVTDENFAKIILAHIVNANAVDDKCQEQ